MLYGIGCDLCSLSHLEKSLSSAHAAAFVRRVYGPAEQAALGLLEASPAPLNAHRLASAAADFAAKEAFLKAVGTGLREPFSLCEIEAVRQENGAPAYRFSRTPPAHTESRQDAPDASHSGAHPPDKQEGDSMEVHRGEVFYADLSPVVGSEQGGVRPVLIVQNEIGNRHSPTVIAAAITSRLDKTRLPTHINIRAADTGLAKDSVVLLEQIRTLDKHRLRERAGQITAADQKRVDQALDVSLGLSSY